MIKTSAAVATGAVLATLLAGSAAAQAGPWTGAYVGGSLGYAAQKEEGETILFDKNLDGAFNETVTTTAGANAFSPGFCGGRARGSAPATGGCEEDEDNVDLAVRAGYDFQTGPFVLGALVEASAPGLSDSVSAFSTTPAGYTMTRNLQSVLAARLRGGYAFDRYLGYVTGGVARGDIRNSFITTNLANSFTQRGDDKADGYQLGAGVETRVAGGLTVGLEYLWTSLEDESHRLRAAGPVAATNPFILTNPAGTDFRRSDDTFEFGAFRLTAAYRF